MGTKFWAAMLYILLGVMIAGVIMTALSLLEWVGVAIVAVVLTLLVLLPMIRLVNKKYSPRK
jgi:hypothetical protein